VLSAVCFCQVGSTACVCSVDIGRVVTVSDVGAIVALSPLAALTVADCISNIDSILLRCRSVRTTCCQWIDARLLAPLVVVCTLPLCSRETSSRFVCLFDSLLFLSAGLLFVIPKAFCLLH